MVVTQDEKLAEMVRVLRVHGSQPKYFHRLIAVTSGSMRCRQRSYA